MPGKDDTFQLGLIIGAQTSILEDLRDDNREIFHVNRQLLVAIHQLPDRIAERVTVHNYKKPEPWTARLETLLVAAGRLASIAAPILLMILMGLGRLTGADVAVLKPLLQQAPESSASGSAH